MGCIVFIGLKGNEWVEENKGWAGYDSCDSFLGQKGFLDFRLKLFLAFSLR